MSLTINLLPAKGGDCIHIRFIDGKGSHNIVIDSGPSQNKRRFKALLEQIRKNKEQVDLLCLSHIDDDHIKSAQMILAQEESYDHTLIQEVWFNIPTKSNYQDIPGHTILGSIYRNLSVGTAEALYQILLQRQITVRTEVLAGSQFNVGEAQIEILSPDQVRHDEFVAHWDNLLAKKMAGYGGDSSKTNGDSIAFLLSFNGSSYLFLGDAYASVVVESLGNRFETSSPVVVKLAHHGSSNNINEALLQRLNTRSFLISSVEESARPSQETIALLEAYKPDEEKNVYCNFTCGQHIVHSDKLHIHDLRKRAVELADGIILYSEGYDD